MSGTAGSILVRNAGRVERCRSLDWLEDDSKLPVCCVWEKANIIQNDTSQVKSSTDQNY